MTNSTKSSNSALLGLMLSDAIDEAAAQKRRVRERLCGMRGDFGSAPVRGPWKPGRPGVKWHLWNAARAKHHVLTQRVRALAWALKQIQP